MSLDPAMMAALDVIYAAAADESLWPEVVRNLLGLLDSQAGSFCVLDGSEQPKLPVFSYLNIETRSVDRDRFMQEYLQGGVAEQDPTVRYLVAHPTQRLVRDSMFITEAEKDRHFYYDWHGSFSDTRHRMAGMSNPAPNIQSGITLHRTRQRGDFDPGDVERFEFLLPHIERAVRIGFQLGTLGTLQRASAELLDRNGRAIILLSRDGRVVFANRAAAALAAAQEGVRLSADGLTFQRASDNRRLQKLISEALTVPAATGESAVGVMRALRASGRPPLSVLVSPMSPATMRMSMARPAVCIVIADPDSQKLLPEAAVGKLFGLTPSEARLAVKLAQGKALNASASELGIAYTTARTQLAAIFRKTGASRQGELVKLLLADVPVL